MKELKNKIPCERCRHNKLDSGDYVLCEFSKKHTEKDMKQTKLIRQSLGFNKEGLEIVPKTVFNDKDTTCAAMS